MDQVAQDELMLSRFSLVDSWESACPKSKNLSLLPMSCLRTAKTKKEQNEHPLMKISRFSVHFPGLLLEVHYWLWKDVSPYQMLYVIHHGNLHRTESRMFSSGWSQTKENP